MVTVEVFGFVPVVIAIALEMLTGRIGVPDAVKARLAMAIFTVEFDCTTGSTNSMNVCLPREPPERPELPPCGN